MKAQADGTAYKFLKDSGMHAGLSEFSYKAKRGDYGYPGHERQAERVCVAPTSRRNASVIAPASRGQRFRQFHRPRHEPANEGSDEADL